MKRLDGKQFIVALTILLCAPLALAGLLEDGITAQNRGDMMKALTNFRQLAAQGDADGQFRLSLMYSGGRGVAVDNKEAVRLLRLAARQNHGDAQSNLGVAYNKGRGATPDIVRAHMWFSVSALSGNPDAATNREVAERRMTPQQVKEATAMALYCQQNNFKGCD